MKSQRAACKDIKKNYGECGGGNESASRAPAAGGRGAPPPGEDGAMTRRAAKEQQQQRRQSTPVGGREGRQGRNTLPPTGMRQSIAATKETQRDSHGHDIPQPVTARTRGRGEAEAEGRGGAGAGEPPQLCASPLRFSGGVASVRSPIIGQAGISGILDGVSCLPCDGA